MNTYYIYKICCEDPLITDFYIGSSKNIRDRKSKHKSACNGDKINLKIYQIIRANAGWENFRMVIIEELPDTTRIAAQIREEYWRVELSATMNTNRAYSDITNAERCRAYREQNPELCRIQDRIYYENNKEAIKEKKNEKFNCQCGGKYTYASKSRHMKTSIQHLNYMENKI